MTTEEEEYYETYFDMFTTEGWKQLISELEATYNGYSFETCSNVEELHRVKGERSVLNKILTFQTGIETAYAVNQEDNSSYD